jgi:RNA polymerase sigma-70 factor (ECF subfamily)
MRPEADELKLAIRARDGDREALGELIERLRLSLFALAYAELRHYEDAQDAVAAALVQICLHAGDLKAPESIRAWMHTIVRNETHRLRRGSQRRHAALDEANSPGIADPSPLLRLDVERALRQLPADQGRAMALFYLSEWPIGAIARHLARPEGTIKRWLHQGRRRLAAEMKGYLPMETMASNWKACVVAPELAPQQLQRVTDALKAAGWPDVHTVTDLRSLDDLYRIETQAGRTVASWIDEQGEEHQLAEQRTARLAEPLAGSRFVILGERIAGRSAFEFMPILRAIPEPQNMMVCLLIDAPTADSTVYATSLSGIQLCLMSQIDTSEYQPWFKVAREELEKLEKPL